MKLSSVMNTEFIIPKCDCENSNQLLSQIAEVAAKSSILSKVGSEKIKQALLNREELGSTAFGNGIAIPHCALDDIDGFVVGMARIPEGVEMKSLDGAPVKLAVFIIGPASKRTDHIHLLSKISKVLNSEDGRAELLATDNATLILEAFLKYASDEVASEDADKNILSHIFVQNEDWFDDIIQVLSEVESSVISIVRADDTAHYLDAMPLFSGFLTDKKGFNRVIISVIPKAFANDAIRRVADITGELSKASGIKIVMQELFYSAGNIEY